ncbi:hypothetical protein BLA39750_01313 [Burkholderia lata]|uniref:Uncharacterized protein n=1 Tax=Burkholderia lata (strain ATCC 17760 / DSM 23089 / LMG 22485 / NCIMB 9086 / R18194 / 383) TaxID=482957 RepID=A0A6P2VW72_BURL3|nr:hypothetical protein [Burkholderia lata]VWC82594.1 hypothetical protein BLA39750_01313 [Burkholderia lata]
MNREQAEIYGEAKVRDYDDSEYWDYVVGEFTCGLCSELAITLHDRYGWALMAEIANDGGLFHAWVVNERGNAIDINGVHTDGIARTYTDDSTTIRTLSRAQLLAFGVNQGGLTWAIEIVDAKPRLLTTHFDWSKSRYAQSRIPIGDEAGQLSNATMRSKPGLASSNPTPEAHVRTTHADQGGAGTFENWVRVTASDPLEIGHPEAVAYLNVGGDLRDKDLDSNGSWKLVGPRTAARYSDVLLCSEQGG